MRRGRKRATAGFVLFSAPRARDGVPRIGITVAKTVGIAVARNRTRRRVKAVLDGLRFVEAADLLFVMRPGSAEMSFDELARDVARALSVVP